GTKELFAPDQTDASFMRAGLQRVFQAGADGGAFGRIVRIAADHDVQPARQRATQRFPCLAAHDDGAAHGAAFEVRKIPRQAPGKAVVAPDDAVTAVCDDDLKERLAGHAGVLSRSYGRAVRPPRAP